MSAWIVSQGHIDVLVNGLVQHGLVQLDTADRVGQFLWDENHASINARYGEASKAPAYKLQLATQTIAREHLISAIGCFAYQSCEHGGWEASASKMLMDLLAETLEEEQPGVRRHGVPTVYSDSDGPGVRWGYDTLEQAYEVVR